MLAPIFEALIPILGVLVALAVLEHLVFRGLYAWFAPSLREQKVRGERVKVRIAELDALGLNAADKADRTMKIHVEEGASPRPAVMLIVGVLGIGIGAFALSWFAFSTLGGPLATNIWWFGVVYKLGFAAPGVWKLRKEEGGKPAWVWGIGAVVAVLFVSPVVLVFAFAPVGVVLFSALSTLVAKVAWRLSPYQLDDMPKVALLFM